MDLSFEKSFELKQFFEENNQNFESTLLAKAESVRDKIDEILRIGNINLIHNAHKLVMFIIEGQDEEIKTFAKQEGILWATYSIPLTFKLEWIQAIRQTLWIYIERYNNRKSEQAIAEFFILEKEINSRVDGFFSAFFLSYSEYKDQLIKSQKAMVENLSAPIIPINPSIGILPLIGSLDETRAEILEEKVLKEIGETKIETLIVDFSGVAKIELEIIDQMKRTMDSVSLMGCSTVITGLRMEVARKITKLGVSFNRETKTLGTLQQALKAYL